MIKKIIVSCYCYDHYHGARVIDNITGENITETEDEYFAEHPDSWFIMDDFAKIMNSLKQKDKRNGEKR